MSLFRLGLIINPYAGIGGALALKGSDGAQIREQALAMGAEKKANAKTRLALEQIVAHRNRVQVLTVGGEMGQDLAQSMGFSTEVLYQPAKPQTEAQDTLQAAKVLLNAGLDFLLFAGGDGTARNICDVVGDALPVLGVPAGCKIHSGVYGITPKSAGRVLDMLIKGEILSLDQAEVKDIDEDQFRQGKVLARHYGEMRVPSELRYVQAVKMGGKESDELVLTDIAAHVIEDMQDHPEHLYLMGSGSTVAGIMQELGLANTLLGVDVIKDQQLLAADVNEQTILTLLKNNQGKILITPIGGQGHIFGRGNQQLSPAVIDAVGKDNILLVAAKRKLQALRGRPLIADTGDQACDLTLAGLIAVITGYKDQVLYQVAEPEG